MSHPSNIEKKSNKKDPQQQPLCSFLSSSLNVELVYVILTSVVSFVKDRQFWSQNNIDQQNQASAYLNTSQSKKNKSDSEEIVHSLGKNRSRKYKPKVEVLNPKQIEPSILILPFIKIETPKKFWEGKESNHENFCGYGVNDKRVT